MDLVIFVLIYGLYLLVLFMNAFKLCVDITEIFKQVLLFWLAVACAVFNEEMGAEAQNSLSAAVMWMSRCVLHMTV